jgi:dsDNA-specific endonuclease/ATPase MutS2
VKQVPIEDSIDLHSFRSEDVLSVVSEYLDQAIARGLREVRLIHGKGKGVRRAELRRFLSNHPQVEDVFDAPPERGGFGATIVLLKKGTDPFS